MEIWIQGMPLSLLGSEKLFWNVLEDYYNVINKKADLIKSLEEAEDWPTYTIEVHALKSASRQIGAISLSDKAADMEKVGNDRNKALIHEKTDDRLEQYREYIDILAEFFPEEEESEESKEACTEEIIATCFARMRQALEDLDMDQMDEVAEEMKKYRYDDRGKKYLDELLVAVAEMDVDTCGNVMMEWEQQV